MLTLAKISVSTSLVLATVFKTLWMSPKLLSSYCSVVLIGHCQNLDVFSWVIGDIVLMMGLSVLQMYKHVKYFGVD